MGHYRSEIFPDEVENDVKVHAISQQCRDIQTSLQAISASKFTVGEIEMVLRDINRRACNTGLLESLKTLQRRVKRRK